MNSDNTSVSLTDDETSIELESILQQFKLVIGLGNPGDKYQNTRHNAGYLFLNHLLHKLNGNNWKQDNSLEAELNTVFYRGERLILARPTTFMNASGRAVQKIMQYYRIKANQLLLVYDDLDLELGNFKLQQGKFPKVHNGLSSVADHLKLTSITHLRLGVDNREVKGNKGIPGMRYTLERFNQQERKTFDTMIESAYKQLISTK